MNFKPEHIAPCGINCATCLGYLRKKNKCSGCNSLNGFKPYHCNVCSIKNCEYLTSTKSKFCFECSKFPCSRLKQLDKRYKMKYKHSLIENLNIIHLKGMDEFLISDNERWTCKTCTGAICVHTGTCLTCSAESK
jgi:hypothetical protein